jgi:hypothetical protein
MLVLGRIAASNVTAFQAKPEVDPAVAHLQAFFAAFAARGYVANFFQVGTVLRLGHRSSTMAREEGIQKLWERRRRARGLF